MTFLFVYDHLMDYSEFKKCLPNIKFNVFGIGVINNYSLVWEAKGIPFVCRKRPTLFHSSNKETYGIILKISSYERKLVEQYMKYLSNNQLINIEIQIIEINNSELINYSEKKDELLEKKLVISKNDYNQNNNVNGITFVAETENLVFDKELIESILSKGGEAIFKSRYFKDIRKMSENINPIFPSDKYINNLIDVARNHSLPEEYIQNYINVSNKQKLTLIERVVREILVIYMYLITMIKQQEIGFGIIDLLWELDPNDPIVFGDYGNINSKIILFVTVLILFSLLPLLSIYSIYIWSRSY